MCNCKDEIEKKMRIQKGTNKVFMMSHGRSEMVITPITLAGDYSKHHRYSSVYWKYCPFCGEEIKSD